ncbi:hypothetical protein D3C73_593800 [compost metagenome]
MEAVVGPGNAAHRRKRFLAVDQHLAHQGHGRTVTVGVGRRVQRVHAGHDTDIAAGTVEVVPQCRAVGNVGVAHVGDRLVAARVGQVPGDARQVRLGRLARIARLDVPGIVVFQGFPATGRGFEALDAQHVADHLVLDVPAGFIDGQHHLAQLLLVDVQGVGGQRTTIGTCAGVDVDLHHAVVQVALDQQQCARGVGDALEHLPARYTFIVQVDAVAVGRIHPVRHRHFVYACADGLEHFDFTGPVNHPVSAVAGGLEHEGLEFVLRKHRCAIGGDGSLFEDFTGVQRQDAVSGKFGEVWMPAQAETRVALVERVELQRQGSACAVQRLVDDIRQLDAHGVLPDARIDSVGDKVQETHGLGGNESGHSEYPRKWRSTLGCRDVQGVAGVLCKVAQRMRVWPS